MHPAHGIVGSGALAEEAARTGSQNDRDVGDHPGLYRCHPNDRAGAVLDFCSDSRRQFVPWIARQWCGLLTFAAGESVLLQPRTACLVAGTDTKALALR